MDNDHGKIRKIKWMSTCTIDMNWQGSQTSKILMNVCMICLLSWTIFFSIISQSSRIVKHHTDHHKRPIDTVHPCEVEPEIWVCQSL